jgi:hypothetical protein
MHLIDKAFAQVLLNCHNAAVEHLLPGCLRSSAALRALIDMLRVGAEH